MLFVMTFSVSVIQSISFSLSCTLTSRSWCHLNTGPGLWPWSEWSFSCTRHASFDHHDENKTVKGCVEFGFTMGNLRFYRHLRNGTNCSVVSQRAGCRRGQGVGKTGCGETGRPRLVKETVKRFELINIIAKLPPL